MAGAGTLSSPHGRRPARARGVRGRSRDADETRGARRPHLEPAAPAVRGSDRTHERPKNNPNRRSHQNRAPPTLEGTPRLLERVHRRSRGGPSPSARMAPRSRVFAANGDVRHGDVRESSHLRAPRRASVRAFARVPVERVHVLLSRGERPARLPRVVARERLSVGLSHVKIRVGARTV